MCAHTQPDVSSHTGSTFAKFPILHVRDEEEEGESGREEFNKSAE